MGNKPTSDSIDKVSADRLYRRCDLSKLKFETTEDLTDPEEDLVGQDRALSAAEFGIQMEGEGYNVFALGPEETDKRDLLERLISREVQEHELSDDWCYVCNYSDEQKPKALRLPPGKAKQFQQLMHELASELPNVLTSTFESEEYQNQRQAIEEEAKEQEQRTFRELQKKAESKGLTLMSSPSGFTIAPVKDGKMMKEKEINELPEEERKQLEEEVMNFQKELSEALHRLPGQQRQYREKRQKLDKEVATYAVKDLIKKVEAEFGEYEAVQKYINETQEDIVNHISRIMNPGGQNPMQQALQQMGGGVERDTSNPADDPVLWRYTVNVIVDNSQSTGAPVIYEDNPTYTNLLGRIEHISSQMGALTTDFTHIKPGALHRANGGYLLIDAFRILTKPYAWDGLKRALQGKKLKIESPGEMYGLFSTKTLEPDPIDLNIKVILFGNRLLYYLLCQYDQDFNNLFKVEVDFEDDMPWNDENQELYARLIGSMARKLNLKPVDKSGVERVIEYAARLVDDSEKITAEIRKIEDLLNEANFWSRKNGNTNITRDDVNRAIEHQYYRSGRLRDRVQEEIKRKNIFIDSEGARIGQVNGLSVLKLGNTMFGRPTRITARVQLGRGEVSNIEREVEMSGPIHSKGVLILSSFLGARYALQTPLSISASLVFEQSYSGVDGDSASSTELYALLSAIAEIPLKQSIAVTGSVNQHGTVQPIGGVNEKIEGFFDICNYRGLTGDQGVLIPTANMKNLMLRSDIIEAVEQNQFHIYPVDHIDQGMQILTGMEMGVKDESGVYPEGTVNAKVNKALSDYASLRQKYSVSENGSSK